MKIFDVMLEHKKWAIIAAVPIVIVIVAFFVWKKESAANIKYQEIAVTYGNIQSTILSTGIVQPENRLEIKPPVSGRIDEVLVDEGYIVKKGQVLAKMSSMERAALLDAARAISSAEYDKWDNYYRSAPIFAPIDGTIILRNVQPGQTVTNADAVLVMSDRLTVQAQVDETDIAQIKLKQYANVILDAYPGQNIPSHVDKIAYDSKTINNVTTYIVDVLPDETPDFMRSGMTANVSFLVDSKENVLMVPSNAIHNKEGKNFVLVPSEHLGKPPVEKNVELGISDGKKLEVLSGLSDGDKVLVEKMKIRNGAATSASPFSPMGTQRR